MKKGSARYFWFDTNRVILFVPSNKLILAVLLAALSGFFAPSAARMKEGINPSGWPAAALKRADIPNRQHCTHKSGRFWFTVTNYGVLGNRGDNFLRDCLTGHPTSSAEFPGGSKVEYLFQGSLWVGGIVDIDSLTKDTLVSVGTDGWALQVGNFNPDVGFKGEMVRRSRDPASPFYSPEAVSDQDFIATMYDTFTTCIFANCLDEDEGTPFRALGLKVIQSSYSWTADWGRNWVLLDYKIINISHRPIREVYAGLFMDADVGHIGTSGYSKDDLSGFMRAWPSVNYYHSFFRINASGLSYQRLCMDTLNLAYSYDNDGDPGFSGLFEHTSPTGVTALRLLQTPRPRRSVKLSFNWWNPDSQATRDWGPQKTPGVNNFAGGLGQPAGRRMKYSYLSNRQIDYDQVYTLFNQRDQDIGFGTGWLPPPQPQIEALDIAGGYDTRYLLSFGDFNLDVGDTLPFTLAIAAGEDFHQDPLNFETNLGTDISNYLDTNQVNAYRQNLKMQSLADHARMAENVYDNQTDSSRVICRIIRFDDISIQIPGYQYRGDGIPDFRGPIPPEPPEVEFLTREGEVTVRWFGRKTETMADGFTRVPDFEGYRVYLSTDGKNFSLIGSYDKIDYKQMLFVDNLFSSNWVPAPGRPFSYDEIQEIYATRWDTCRNKPGSITRPIDPKRYNRLPSRFPRTDISRCNPDTLSTAFRIRGWPGIPDSTFFLIPQDYNLGLEQARMYPAVTDPNNDSAYWYQHKISGLLPSQPVWIAVAPFDFKFNAIAPAEVDPRSIARLVYPLSGDSARRAANLKISAYPNPYRLDHDYSQFEKPKENKGVLPSSQKINFINLPPSCVIRIYTLDGDLVQEIKHDKNPATSDAGHEEWNLLTRNTQAVVAGLYLYTVQSDEGTFVGKLVIIK